jgi:hypothetical protein
MPSKQLEFRGIPVNHLAMYLEELGGDRITDTMPFLYEGDGWTANIITEQEIAFTSVFKVNAVQILFTANDEETLKQLIKNYRYKTTRIGG